MRLNRELVVRTALRLLNDVGLEGLTLRRLAQELGVQAPALYWHFKNKQALLDEMATTVLKDAVAAAAPPAVEQSWAEWLAEVARGQRRMLLSYRDGAKVFSGTYLTGSTMHARMEEGLRKLTDAGFSLRDAVRASSTVTYYTIGLSIEEQAVYPRPGQWNEPYDLARCAERIDGQRYPLALAAGEDVVTGYDARFEHGLRLILRGIEQSLAADRQ
jgi:TetR/AcrR family tetracycline transcriptional repressor